MTRQTTQFADCEAGSPRTLFGETEGSILYREWARVSDQIPWVAMVTDQACAVLEQSADVPRVLVEPLPVIVEDGVLKSNARDAGRKLSAFFERLERRPTRVMIGDETGRHWVLLRGWRIDGYGDWAAIVHCVTSQPVRQVRDTGLPEQFGLTHTESIVLEKIAELKKPAMIAQELAISESTVRSHLKQLHVKLEVASSQQLLLKARAFCNT